MSPRKESFKEPIVRVNTTKIRFPKMCPVCGSNVTMAIRVSTIPGRKQWLRPQWDPMFSARARRRAGVSLPQAQTFMVPVCEAHHYGNESEWRYRLLCLIIDGILLSTLFFALVNMGSNFWLGRVNPFWVYLVLGVFVVVMVLSYLTFKSNQFESAFRIVGFDDDLQHVWLKLKNHKYRDALLNENPMSSEIVSWIIRR